MVPYGASHNTYATLALRRLVRHLQDHSGWCMVMVLVASHAIKLSFPAFLQHASRVFVHLFDVCHLTHPTGVNTSTRQHSGMHHHIQDEGSM